VRRYQRSSAFANLDDEGHAGEEEQTDADNNAATENNTHDYFAEDAEVANYAKEANKAHCKADS
jgi:hypothetical protein